MALGGFLLWLPATVRGLHGALQFNVSFTGQARRLNMHKTIGVYAGLIILSSALTGLPQAFEWYEAGLYRLTGSPHPTRPAAATGAPSGSALGMEALWQRARVLVPEPQEALVHYPARPQDPVEWILIERDAPHPNARTLLYLDPVSAATIRFTPYAQASLGHRLVFWMLSWHTGQIGGWPGALLLLIGALMVPVLAYTGISSYLRRKTRTVNVGRIPVRVRRKINQTGEVCTLELLAAHGAALPPFAAGAHISVFLGGGIVRDYSLCNAPSERDRYLIAVQREPHSRGGSRALHDDIGEGDLIEISAPRNHFPLADNADDAILLAGGIGVTPLLAMAEDLTARGVPFVLHYCTRSAAHTPFVDRIAASPYAQHVVFHFSDGEPGQLLDLHAVLQQRAPCSHLYVCGPIGFMTTALDAARQGGWPESQVHKEFFAADVLPSENDIAFDVRLAGSDQVVHVARGQTVLDALAANGVAVPSACRQGVCGTCITRVLSGQPEHRDRYLTPEEQRRNDQFAPCCSRARGPLVLDL
jgi:vanillate O-demethylase ferredoxin subunit